MLIQDIRLNMMVNTYSLLLIYSDQCNTNFVIMIDVKYDIRKISASCKKACPTKHLFTSVSFKTGGFLERFSFLVREVGNKAARKLNRGQTRKQWGREWGGKVEIESHLLTWSLIFVWWNKLTPVMSRPMFLNTKSCYSWRKTLHKHVEVSVLRITYLRLQVTTLVV